MLKKSTNERDDNISSNTKAPLAMPYYLNAYFRILKYAFLLPLLYALSLAHNLPFGIIDFYQWQGTLSKQFVASCPKKSLGFAFRTRCLHNASTLFELPVVPF